MQSPFKVFRKHQKVVLAGLTLMAMIGFGLGDTLMKMAGRFGGSQQGVKDVVETNVGNLSQIQMNNLIVHRRNLQRFIMMAFQRSHPDLEKNAYLAQYYTQQIVAQFGFGGTSRTEMLYNWLHRREARKMGITVSDPQIESYINRFTDRKLSTKKFQEILDDMRMSPKELFDSFREELQADIILRMTHPVVLPSPEKYWECYKQLNTREKIEAAAVPVKDFTEKIAEPTGTQIADLFEKHKNSFEQAFNGEFKPGFRQPRKVKLHYLTLSYAAVEEKVRAGSPVTAAEIEEYYERNKDLDRSLQQIDAAPPGETDPIEPEFAPEKGPSLESDSPEKSPGAAAKSEEKQTDPGKEGAKPPADGEPDAKGAKPDESQGAPKDTGTGETPAEKGPDQGPDCAPPSAADDAEGSPDASKDGGDQAGEKPQESSADSPATTAQDKDSNDKDTASKESQEKAKEDEAAAESDDKPIIGGKPKKAAEPPKISYKPLDDELREIVREKVIRERTLKALKAETTSAVEAMRTVGLRFATSTEMKLTDPGPEELKALDRESEQELRKIADHLGLKFESTGLVSGEELAEIPGIGRAVEPGSGLSVRGEQTGIVDQAFSNEALCRVTESEIPETTTYVWWKVEDAPIHIPQLADPGIREQVVNAWKRIEALPLARKRAEALAEKARGAKQDLAAALGSETVTGDPGSLTLTVAESKEFSFWQDSSVPNMFQPSVRLGDPIIITKPGRKFMRVVFEELGEGETGVALNDDASVYYVVKVISRRPADRESFKDAALFGPSSPYTQIASVEQRLMNSEYFRRMDEKYAIKWNEMATREMGPGGDEE